LQFSGRMLGMFMLVSVPSCTLNSLLSLMLIYYFQAKEKDHAQKEAVASDLLN
jgi:hypothetical protein